MAVLPLLLRVPALIDKPREGYRAVALKLGESSHLSLSLGRASGGACAVIPSPGSCPCREMGGLPRSLVGFLGAPECPAQHLQGSLQLKNNVPAMTKLEC